MPRRIVVEPTYIYCLLDTRPETMAQGWPHGEPFYVGKTIKTPKNRFSGHKWEARNNPKSERSKYILKCGEHIAVRTLEIVPARGDWREREKHWIRLFRGSFPNIVNATDGGEGVPGLVRTEEQLQNMRGKKKSPETRAKIRAALLGRKSTLEANAKRSAALKGIKRTADEIAKSAIARRGLKRSPEVRARISATHKGIPWSPARRVAQENRKKC